MSIKWTRDFVLSRSTCFGFVGFFCLFPKESSLESWFFPLLKEKLIRILEAGGGKASMVYVSIHCPLLAASRHCNIGINLAEAGCPPKRLGKWVDRTNVKS